eukprot:NODE_281_length_1695_cov_180.230255_g207_i0.p1 GENE.NODE_281_length_1695_cov_180.230255_g207_i0~~NODE_281_length_1695_cov_180.230255_g207_i0.p1  ORF type:complete len:468 (-),score=138.94 NODE_281_length_1695_cov_180.230255_g207_i0:223-1626(-)
MALAAWASALVTNVKALPSVIGQLDSTWFKKGLATHQLLKERRRQYSHPKPIVQALNSGQFIVIPELYWGDDTLPEVMVRSQYQHWLQWRKDLRKLTPLVAPIAFGGLGLLYLSAWLGRPHLLPSAFLQSAEQKAKAGIAEDLERTKEAAHLRMVLKEHISGVRFGNPIVRKDTGALFEELFNMQKESLRPEVFTTWYEYLNGYKQSHFSRLTRDEVRLICQVLGLRWRFQRRYDMHVYIEQFFETIYTDDAFLRNEGVDSLKDDDLFKACHDRRIARWEEKVDGVSREELLHRLKLWLQLTAPKPNPDYEEQQKDIWAYDAKHPPPAGGVATLPVMEPATKRCPVILLLVWQASTFIDPPYDPKPELVEEERILSDPEAARYYYTDLAKAYYIYRTNALERTHAEQIERLRLEEQKAFEREVNTQKSIEEFLAKVNALTEKKEAVKVAIPAAVAAEKAPEEKAVAA